jgi:DNA-binding CsgD family transcriptional regulator
VIQEWLAAPEQRPLVLVGEPGAGTTALLDAAAEHGRQTGHTVVTDPRMAEKRPAGGPLLVVADDLHALGERGRQAWAAVAERPVALLGAARAKIPSAGALVIGPLSAPAAGELVDRTAPDLDPVVRQRVLADARGNPLALVELADAWRKAGDPPGTDVLRRYPPMTERLRTALVPALPGPESVALLVAALDFGGGVTGILDAAGHATGTDLTAAVFDTAAAAGLVTLADGWLRFAGDLVRAAVVASAGPGRQVTAHTALEASTEHVPYRHAWHRAQTRARPDEDTAAALEATVADCRDDAVEALRRLVHAAGLTPGPAGRRRRLMAAAAAAFELGRPALGEHLLTAAERIQPAGDVRMWAYAVRLRFHEPPRPAWDSVAPLCSAARSLAGDGDEDAALDVLVTAAYRLWWTDPDATVREQVAAAARHIEHAGRDPRLAVVRAMVAAHAEEPPPVLPDAGTRWLLGLAALARDDCPRAVDLLGSAAGTLRAGDRIGLLTHVQGLHAEAATALGAWDTASAAAAECLALADRTDQPVWQAQAHACLALLAALRGDADSAWQHAAHAEPAVSPSGFPVVPALARLARGVAMLNTGAHADAFVALGRLFDRREAHYSRRIAAHAVGYLVEAAVSGGRHDDARAVLDRYADVPTTPLLAANLSYANALLADDHETDAGTEARFEQARQDASAWPWLSARLDLARGVWLRRRRRVLESRMPLRSALHAFDALGAVTWAGWVRSELGAAGVDAKDGQQATVLLTRQELQIARLAAAGLSNREIGERMFLSHRTVGSHLYKIFPKLNVTSRTQLADRIGDDMTSIT